MCGGSVLCTRRQRSGRPPGVIRSPSGPTNSGLVETHAASPVFGWRFLSVGKRVARDSRYCSRARRSVTAPAGSAGPYCLALHMHDTSCILNADIADVRADVLVGAQARQNGCLHNGSVALSPVGASLRYAVGLERPEYLRITSAPSPLGSDFGTLSRPMRGIGLDSISCYANIFETADLAKHSLVDPEASAAALNSRPGKPGAARHPPQPATITYYRSKQAVLQRPLNLRAL
jgi:hypothetical protein